VEAKFIIDRSPQGETAYIILYSEVVGGDEEGAVHSVESAAKTLATTMEGIGMILIDDVRYMGYRTQNGEKLSRTPTKHHVFLMAARSMATVFTSVNSVGLGALGTTMLISGVIGLIVMFRVARAVQRDTWNVRHLHWSLGGGEIQLLEDGVLVRRENGETVVSKHISITGNNNRELSSKEIDRRLPMYLATFNNLIYSLRDFRIALHIAPQSAGDTIKLAMASLIVSPAD